MDSYAFIGTMNHYYVGICHSEIFQETDSEDELNYSQDGFSTCEYTEYRTSDIIHEFYYWTPCG